MPDLKFLKPIVEELRKGKAKPKLNSQGSLLSELREWQSKPEDGPQRIFETSDINDEQIDSIQQKWGFTFPPDLRWFLKVVKIGDSGLVDWKNTPEEQIKAKLDWPLEGILFDVEQNDLWLKRWGKKPYFLDAKKEIVKKDSLSWPKLIPIYGHRYIPEHPSEIGNPVFSVYQSDIIYYGDDLASYLISEFKRGSTYHPSESIKRIPIWSDWVDLNNDFIESF